MDNNKQCKTCGETKSLHDFYKHKGMKDGHLNECTDCFRVAALDRANKKKEDPDWVEKKRESSRRSYQRNKELRKFPWKNEAKYKNLKFKFPLEPGFKHHHWNLNEEFQEDIFVLSVENKVEADKLLTIDMDSRMYITRDGRKLDTKNKHRNYLVSELGKQIFSKH